jgi:hypothetical protein
MKTDLYVLATVSSCGLVQAEYIHEVDIDDKTPSFINEISKAMKGTKSAMIVIAEHLNKFSEIRVILTSAK